MQSGGQGVYLANVTRALARLGHDVHVISGPPYPTLDAAVTHHTVVTHSFQRMMLDRRAFFHDTPASQHFAPLNLYEFASTRFTLTSVMATFTLRALARLAQVEAMHGPFDVVHDNQSLGYGLLGMQRFLGRRVVANVHHPLDVDMRSGVAHVASIAQKVRRIAWYPWYMQKFVARRLDGLISGSNASAALIEDLWSLPRGHITTIYDGVDTDRFRAKAAGETLPGTLLFVGNAEDYNKGVVYLLRAMARIRRDTDAHLYIVGGPSGEQRIAPQEIARLGIEDRVTVVGRVTDDELAAWYRRAQLLVSPSLYEGFGLPAAEAMASGTPVIASDAGALPEVVAHHETGVIVPAADHRALAATITSLLEDPERCERMGEAGTARVHDRFTWRHHARGLEAFYANVLGSPVRDGATA
jgi:glycosyltransferase involved in cell wall biosynthesis